MTQYLIATRGGSLHVDEIKSEVPGIKIIDERSKFHVVAESELDVDALRELLPNYIVEVNDFLKLPKGSGEAVTRSAGSSGESRSCK